jgi:hypothetical protein
VQSVCSVCPACSTSDITAPWQNPQLLSATTLLSGVIWIGSGNVCERERDAGSSR